MDPAFIAEIILRILCSLVWFCRCLLLLLWDYTVCSKKKKCKPKRNLNCPTLTWCLNQNYILLKLKKCFKDSFSSGALQRIEIIEILNWTPCLIFFSRKWLNYFHVAGRRAGIETSFSVSEVDSAHCRMAPMLSCKPVIWYAGFNCSCLGETSFQESDF